MVLFQINWRKRRRAAWRAVWLVRPRLNPPRSGVDAGNKYPVQLVVRSSPARRFPSRPAHRRRPSPADQYRSLVCPLPLPPLPPVTVTPLVRPSCLPAVGWRRTGPSPVLGKHKIRRVRSSGGISSLGYRTPRNNDSWNGGVSYPRSTRHGLIQNAENIWGNEHSYKLKPFLNFKTRSYIRGIFEKQESFAYI